MIRKYLLPSLAICGALIALFVVYWSQKSVPVPPVLYPPPHSPYTSSIAGAGIIEASSRNISIGSPFNELIMEMFVIEGDCVKAGDPLFRLDTRLLEAQKESAQQTLGQAIITLDDKQKQFSFYERIQNKNAVSEQLYYQSLFAMKEAESQVQIAQANIQVIEADIKRSCVRAPIDGLVMQINAHIGETVATVPLINTSASLSAQSPIMFLGSVDPLIVRIDIDENDAWRYQTGARATAFVRGNSCINFPLTFNRIEPFVVPKASFTGETTERIDTRVLQVLYTFSWGDLPVHPGSVLDIFIEVTP